MTNPNALSLAMRDPALAAVLGAIPGHDFGYSAPAPQPVAYLPRHQTQFGDDYGFGDGGPGYDYGFGLSAYDPSMNMGFGFGAPAHPAHRRRPVPHPAHAAHAWHPPAHNPTAARTLLLDPNRDSSVKVERYTFSFSPTSNLVLGTASSIPTFTQNPSTSIKGQRLATNAPMPGFVILSQLQIANVNVFIGGSEDAWTYAATSMGVMLDLPRLDPQNRASAAGSYSGVLPANFALNTSYQFIITLQGPATLAGGYGQ